MSQIQETPYENMAFLYFVQGFIVVFYSNLTMSQCFSDGSAICLAIMCVCVCVCALYIKLNNIICWFIQHNHKIIKTFPPHIYFTQQWCRYLRRLVVMYDNNLWIYLIKSMMVKHAFHKKKPTVFLQKTITTTFVNTNAWDIQKLICWKKKRIIFDKIIWKTFFFKQINKIAI